MDLGITILDDSYAARERKQRRVIFAVVALVLVAAALVSLLGIRFLMSDDKRGKVTTEQTASIGLGESLTSVVAKLGPSRSLTPQSLSPILGSVPSSNPIERHVYLLSESQIFIVEIQNGVVVATYDPMNVANNRYRRPPLPSLMPPPK